MQFNIMSRSQIKLQMRQCKTRIIIMVKIHTKQMKISIGMMVAISLKQLCPRRTGKLAYLYEAYNQVLLPYTV